MTNSPISNLICQPDRLVITANHLFYLDDPVSAISRGKTQLESIPSAYGVVSVCMDRESNQGVVMT